MIELPDHEVVFKISDVLRDARGSIVNIVSAARSTVKALDDLPPIVHMAVIESKQGSVRANHWHPIESGEHQLMYLVSGSYRSLSRRHGAQPRQAPHEQIVVAGDLVWCPPGVDHAYVFLEDSVFLNLNSVERSPGQYGLSTIGLVGEERLVP